MNLDRIKKRRKFEHERTTHEQPSCPHCGTRHHFDSGCPVCMVDMQLEWGAKSYRQLADRMRSEPNLTLRDVAGELGMILNSFRLMAVDYVSTQECKEMGIRYSSFTDYLGLPRTGAKAPEGKKR